MGESARKDATLLALMVKAAACYANWQLAVQPRVPYFKERRGPIMSSLVSNSGAIPRQFIWMAALAGTLILATLALWAHYGTAVFFEMVRTGWAACF
jgi:hypothetical protein